MVLNGVSLKAQPGFDTTQVSFLPPASRNSVSTVFNKELSIYSLLSKINYSLASGRFNFRVTEELNSSLLKYSGSNTTRDENVLKLSGDYNHGNFFNPGFMVSSQLYSDSRTTDINTAASNFGILYNRLLLEDLVNILPFGGLIEDVQSGISNRGLIYGVQGGMERTLFSDFMIGSGFQFRNEDISPRKNTLRDITASVENFFDSEVRNSLSVRYHEAGRDFFFDADSALKQFFLIDKNQQRRNERFINISDEFHYSGLLSNTSVSIGFNFSDRLVERTTRYRRPDDLFPTSFDSQIEELKFDISSGINYTSEVTVLKLVTSYAERNEKFLLINPGNSNPDHFEQRQKNEGIKNNIASQIFLSLTGSVYLSNSDKVDLSLSHFKLRYDTPSNENIDERDELLAQFRVRYTRLINSSLAVFAGFDMSYGKLVYILAARSSNNNTNRIFKLNTGYSYEGPGFRNHGNFEIIANYLVYDFEDLNPGFKSFSFRQISLSDSLTVALGDGLDLEFTGFYKLSEQGDLKWSDYKIKPGREITEILLLPAFATTLGDYTFKLGLRYYSYLSDIIVNEEKKEENYYRGLAPLAEINAFISDTFQLALKGWYEMIDSKGNNRRYLTTLNLSAKWML